MLMRSPRNALMEYYDISKYSIMQLNGTGFGLMKKKPPSTEIKASFRPAAHGLQAALISISGVSFS